MNKKWMNCKTNYITTSHEIAYCALVDGYNINWIDYNSGRIYECYKGTDKRINGDNNIFYGSIIWSGILNLFDIVEKLPNGVEISGYNTDAVYFPSNTEIEEMVVDNLNLESIMKQPIKLNKEEYRECLKEFKFERENFKLTGVPIRVFFRKK